MTVLHYPPGTSKWNKIEHKMFSFISMNWRRVPLVSYEVVSDPISGVKTKTGLKISAKMDRMGYKASKKITDDEFQKVDTAVHETNPDRNYTIN